MEPGDFPQYHDRDILSRIAAQLRARQWRITTAESCTGGGIAYWLTSLAGSSEWFEQAAVVYSNQAKMQRLGVPQTVLDKHGAVSESVVLSMAQGALRQYDAQVALAVSGIAGPGGGSAAKPVGTVWFGLADSLGSSWAGCQHFEGDRETIRLGAIRFGLAQVMRFLSAS